jgi:hypothetical protein
MVIDSDLRIFTTVAALNVAGFDIELGPDYHPIRAELRKIADTLDPDLTSRLKAFYQSHMGNRPHEEQLSKYIALAVNLTDPPELKTELREEALSDAAREVLGFTELLREFFQKARITQRWAQFSPAYEAEMDRIAVPIRNVVLRTDSYLRVALGGPAFQTMRITVELGIPRNTVNLQSHQDNYFVVLGYSAEPRVEEIRHAYLHLRLNNTVATEVAKVKGRDSLLPLIAGVPGVIPEYSSQFHSMMTESLIRAVELRSDRVPDAQARELVKTHYRSGLLLLPYFYDELAAYEASDLSLRDALQTMAAAIDVKKEAERFNATFHAIPAADRTPVQAEAPAAPKTDPLADLLRIAEQAAEKDPARARQGFETVLKEHDPNNGRALYGLGLIALNRTELEDAERYFERAIASPSADASRKTWSHIYLGRIQDFKCNRAAALDHYRRAVSLGDDTLSAQSKAKEGLSKPYGGECRQ